MRWDRAVALSLRRPLQRIGGLEPKSGTPILMYHSVSVDQEKGIAPYYRLTTSPQRFRAQMLRLRQAGRSVGSLVDTFAASTAPKGSSSVHLTFDDGFRDFLTEAWPVLDTLGYTATVFLPTGFIGDTRRSFAGRECLTWNEVRSLDSRGITFGSHTVTHPKLHGAPWESIRKELVDSKAQIEDRLGSPITAFSYPFAFPQGDRGFVQRLQEELSAIGYTVCVTTIVGRAKTGANPLILPRLPVNECDDTALFDAKLAGLYDCMAIAQGGRQRMLRLIGPVSGT